MDKKRKEEDLDYDFEIEEYNLALENSYARFRDYWKNKYEEISVSL